MALEEYYNLPAKYNAPKIRILDDVNPHPAYNIRGHNYFRLRDLALLLMNTPNKFDLVWNEEKKLAEITRGVNYSSKSSPSPKSDGLRRAIISNKLAIEIDGKKMELYGYLIDGYNYYKLRDLQNLLGYKMEWREKEELIDLLLPSLR